MNKILPLVLNAIGVTVSIFILPFNLIVGLLCLGVNFGLLVSNCKKLEKSLEK